MYIPFGQTSLKSVQRSPANPNPITLVGGSGTKNITTYFLLHPYEFSEAHLINSIAIMRSKKYNCISAFLRRIILFVSFVSIESLLLQSNPLLLSTEKEVISQDNRLGFLAIVALQRSASTHLLYEVLTPADACIVPANEIFQNRTRQTKAWKLAGEGLRGGVKSLSPEVLQNFLLNARRKLCDARSEASKKMCLGRCILAFKQFEEHLTRQQHTAVWALANLTIVVLERNPQERFRSEYYALMSNDWNTRGTEAHELRMRKAAIPAMPANGDEYCHTQESKPARPLLCNFAWKHANWYEFVRRTIPSSSRIEMSFNESIAGNLNIVDKIEISMCTHGTGIPEYCSHNSKPFPVGLTE